MNPLIRNRYSLFIREISFCLSSAILLILSLPNTSLWVLAWVGFVPLLIALENKPRHKVFLLGFFTGLIFWLGTIYWLANVTFLGMILLALYLALYFGIFCLIISPITHHPSPITLFFVPSVWVILEYIRSHLFTGFPWALLGYSQYLNLPIIQIADITGAWGVSFLVVMGNIIVYQVLGRRSWVLGKNKIKNLFFALLFIFIALGYGYYKLSLTPNTHHPTPIRISVIQGNIPQALKWDSNAKDYIVNKYLNLSEEAVRRVNGKTDLVIWPEAALPVIPEEDPKPLELVKNFMSGLEAPILFGAVTVKDSAYYNSALLFSREGEFLAQYDKMHLVPFGEYIPLKQVFTFLETIVPIGEFTAGKDSTVFSITNSGPAGSNSYPVKFSVLVCFEDAFGGLARNFVRNGAGFLVNITNDAWFGRTSAPNQHLVASVFRAVENRVFVVRSANTGISAFISPAGKVISKVVNPSGSSIFIDGSLTQEISAGKANSSFYTRYGDVFILLCFVLILYGLVNKTLNKLKILNSKHF